MLSKEINEIAEATNFSQAEQTGDLFFKEGQFLEAIVVYKKIIENGYKVDF